jgi:hypothetical protein
MATRFVSSDGKTVVDVIRRSCTGTGHDGEWFQVRNENGIFAGEAKTVAELGRLVRLDDLQEVHGG